MNDKLLTYRYPRTLHEAASRHLCNADDAVAVEGHKKISISPDDLVMYTTLLCMAVVAVLVMAGVIQ